MKRGSDRNRETVESDQSWRPGVDEAVGYLPNDSPTVGKQKIEEDEWNYPGLLSYAIDCTSFLMEILNKSFQMTSISIR